MQNMALPKNLPVRGGSSPDIEDRAFLTADDILSRPQLGAALVMLAGKLRDRFHANPRLGRALGSHQRWLLSQAAVALHLEYQPGVRDSGLTVGRLRDLITANAAASRNTVLNFLEEMRHYRFVQDIPATQGSRGRRRLIEVSEIAEQAMADWIRINLAALDMLDDGERIAALDANPDLFRQTQPASARACLQDPAWLEPPTDVGLFQWTDGGGLVMDELILRMGDTSPNEDGQISVGAINVRRLADHFLMSHTHLQRLFRKAAEAGILGWSGARRKADLWVSRAFIANYQRWQAVKFSHIDRAFREAQAAAGATAAEPRAAGLHQVQRWS